MMRALLSHVSTLRHRALAVLHRNDQRKADAATRRKLWKQVIAERHKPLDRPAERLIPAGALRVAPRGGMISSWYARSR